VEAPVGGLGSSRAVGVANDLDVRDVEIASSLRSSQ
jgi:hypothetical protein